MIDLDAIEARALAADEAAEHGSDVTFQLCVGMSQRDVAPLVARVRELERKLAECDEETRLR